MYTRVAKTSKPNIIVTSNHQTKITNNQIVQHKGIVQLGQMNPASITNDNITALHRVFGNRTTSRIIARSGKYDKESNNSTAKNNHVHLSSIQNKVRMTDLPNDLKSGIENLSGYSMEDVKVYYNSDKPTHLQAHAYTQGTDIHIASGQEKYLPHEAWHVVQQKQGRVKSTMQLKEGVNINDDDGLEHEASLMGNTVVQSKNGYFKAGPLQKKCITGELIQLRVSVKRNVDDKHKDGFNSYLNKLDEAVTKAYFFVMHYPDLKSYGTLDGHTAHWKEAWNKYQLNGERSLLKAAFGYAVESIATMIYLPAAHGGLSVELQGIRGKTRPDIVLKEGDKDVGWLDITAEDSTGHIWSKSGWEYKKIHLGEVTYPSFDPNMIEENLKNNRIYDDKTDPKEVMHRVEYFKWIQHIRRLHWRIIGKSYFDTPLSSHNKDKKRQYIRQRIADYLNLDYSDLPPQVLGSVMLAMNIGHSKHGYEGNNTIKNTSRAKGESILQQYDRELPVVEDYSSILQNPFNAEELLAMKIAKSGKTGFDPNFNYNPLLSDEPAMDLANTSQREIGILGIAKRLSPLLNKTVSLNFQGLKNLLTHMRQSMRMEAIKSFGIKVKLEDGAIATVKISGMESSTLKMIFLRKQEYQENIRKRRQKLVEQKRLQNDHTRDNMIIPPPPFPQTVTNIQQVNDYIAESLHNQIQFQILGIACEMDDGNQVLLNSSYQNTSGNDSKKAEY